MESVQCERFGLLSVTYSLAVSVVSPRDLLNFAKENNKLMKALAERQATHTSLLAPAREGPNSMHPSFHYPPCCRGFEFIWNHLRMEDVLCYWKRLLTWYSKLVTWTVKKDPSLMHIHR